EIIKPDLAATQKAIKALFAPPPVVKTVIPTSEETGIEWLYQTDLASESWNRPGVLPAGWKKGPGGFGTAGTPGAVVRTVWNTPDIWIRREIEISKTKPKNPYLRVHHDEDVEVYLDGKLILQKKGYTTGYVLLPIPKPNAQYLTPG